MFSLQHSWYVENASVALPLGGFVALASVSEVRMSAEDGIHFESSCCDGKHEAKASAAIILIFDGIY